MPPKSMIEIMIIMNNIREAALFYVLACFFYSNHILKHWNRRKRTNWHDKYILSSVCKPRSHKIESYTLKNQYNPNKFIRLGKRKEQKIDTVPL